MAKRKTRQTPLGTATDNPDGTMDITIDSDKMHQVCMDRALELRRLFQTQPPPGIPLDLVRGVMEENEKHIAKMEALHKTTPKSVLKLKYTPPKKKK